MNILQTLEIEQEFPTTQVDLNQLLKGDAKSPLLLTIQGDNSEFDICDGDLVMVDREGQPKTGDVVIVKFGGDYAFTEYEADKRRGLRLVGEAFSRIVDGDFSAVKGDFLRQDRAERISRARHGYLLLILSKCI